MASPVIATIGTPAESGGPTVTCSPPASIANTNLLIAIVCAENGDAGDASASGWMHKLSFVSGGNKVSILYKYASSESGNYVFTMTSAIFMDGVVMRITGAVTSGDPFDAIGSGDTANSGTATASAITTTQTDTLLLWICSWFLGSTSVSSGPAGMSSVTSNTILSVYSLALATSGSTGAKAGTLSGTDTWLVTLGAIKSAGGSSSTTASPTTAALAMQGRAATMNPFTNVRIREVFINEAGSPVTNKTGLQLLVWYGGSPVGAPDLSYSNVTTDPAGTMSWSLATGTLIYNQSIFYVATDGGASLSMYTCARMTPTYS